MQPLFLFSLAFVLTLDAQDLVFEFLDFAFQVDDPVGQLLDPRLRLLFVFGVLFLLAQHRFAHSVGQNTFIQVPVGLDVHFELVSDAHQKQSPVAAVDRDLADELVEALVVQVLSLEANAGFAGFSELEQFLEILVRAPFRV